jgi:hypothetical protein
MEEYLSRGRKITKIDDISNDFIKKVGPVKRKDYSNHHGSPSPKYYEYETNYTGD